MINDFLIDRINAYLEKQFLHDQARLLHIRNVMKAALDLGEIFSVDKDKIKVAALLHDATKIHNFKENQQLASKMFNELQISEVPRPCLHAYSAAALAKEEFGIKDQDILNAITYHCSGRAKMSKLEKVIFVSDFIEESRDFVSDDMRSLARTNLDKTVYLIMKKTIEYLLENKREVSKLTETAIKYYKSGVEDFND